MCVCGECQMAKVDLHVHSKYSDRPSEWFLQRLGAAESYTEPEAIYDRAKAKGMSFVTITDHNTIDGSIQLAEKYEDTFTGLQSTTYFPEDGCKVHILVYGLTGDQFEEIQTVSDPVRIFFIILSESFHASLFYHFP